MNIAIRTKLNLQFMNEIQYDVPIAISFVFSLTRSACSTICNSIAAALQFTRRVIIWHRKTQKMNVRNFVFCSMLNKWTKWGKIIDFARVCYFDGYNGSIITICRPPVYHPLNNMPNSPIWGFFKDFFDFLIFLYSMFSSLAAIVGEIDVNLIK